MKSDSSARVYAFAGVVCSTVAVVACLISFPAVFNFVQKTSTMASTEVEFCRVQSRELWKEAIALHQKGDVNPERLAKAVQMLKESDISAQIRLDLGELRAKRSAAKTPAVSHAAAPGFIVDRPLLASSSAVLQDTPVVSPPNTASSGSCCTCHRGAIGLQGPPGNPGRDGEDGLEGRHGDNGSPAPVPVIPESALPKQCPCDGLPGDAGGVGPKGPPGRSGDLGSPGDDGKTAPAGPSGLTGGSGLPGNPGQKGPEGDVGGQIPAVNIPVGPSGISGREGLTGNVGRSGETGRPGSDGKNGEAGGNGSLGRDGQPGKNGNIGPVGKPGPKGLCDHCPVPRTAPGY